MTNLTLVTNNPNPHRSRRPPPTLRLAHSQRYRRHPNGAPLWCELDDITTDAMIEGLRERRREREREEWRRLVEAFEWLEDHCWVLPEREEELRKEREREKWSRLIGMGALLAEEDRRFKTDPEFRRWLTEKARP